MRRRRPPRLRIAKLVYSINETTSTAHYFIFCRFPTEPVILLLNCCIIYAQLNLNDIGTVVSCVRMCLHYNNYYCLL